MTVMHGPFGREWPLADVLLCVPQGWGDIVSRLVADMFALGWDGELHQAKEKFGGLRFYVGHVTGAVQRRLDQAERESQRACQVCGKPGRLNEEQYWVHTACPEHWGHRTPEQYALIRDEGDPLGL